MARYSFKYRRYEKTDLETIPIDNIENGYALFKRNNVSYKRKIYSKGSFSYIHFDNDKLIIKDDLLDKPYKP